MSDGLLLYDGGLLFVDGGLTADPDCCCYYEPAECPPCCIKIDWGTFNVDGDLVDDYVVSTIPIAVKIVMPTKNSRIVCNDDIISVEWELDAAADDYGAWARFGVAWMFNGESPLVGASGETYPWGLVDWVGTSSSAFSVSLKFRKCFLDSAQFHGYIYIGTDFPDWELEIDISRCWKFDPCCQETVACVDCCALLDQDGVIVYDGKYYKVIDSLDADGQMFTGIMEIELAVAGLVCKDGGIDIALHLVPPRHSDIENRTVVTFPAPWILGPYSPAINPVDGEETAIKLDWGTLTVYRYDLSLSIECDDELACPPPLEFPTITVTNTPFNFTGEIAFEECDMTDCCEPVCCCTKITGFDIALSGITDSAYTDCDCAPLNTTINAPKTSTIGATCSGSGTVDGMVCGASTGTVTANWTLSCLPDGTHALNVVINVTLSGETESFSLDLVFPACTECDEMIANACVSGCPHTLDTGEGYFCYYLDTVLTATPTMEP